MDNDTKFKLYVHVNMPRIFDRAYELDENIIGSISYKQLRDIALALEQYKDIPEYGPFRDYVDACAVELIETIKSSKENDDVYLEQYKSRLDKFLVNNYGNSPEEIAELSPYQKVESWLEYVGIIGFIDDIIEVISAAYNINLNRD